MNGVNPDEPRSENKAERAFIWVLSSRRTLVILAVCILVLVLLSSVVWVWHARTHPPGARLHRAVALFRLNEEANIPTFFSSVLLLGSSVLLYFITRLKKAQSDPLWRFWLFLAGLFLFLAVDEAAAIHEMLIPPLQKALGVGGVLYYAWIIPGILLILLFSVVFLRFLKNLLPKYRRLFVLAGAVMAGGSIACEMITGYATSKGLLGNWRLVNAAFSTLEEICEMSGSALFLFTLLSLLKDEVSTLNIRIS